MSYFLIAIDLLALGFILGCIYYTIYKIPDFKKVPTKYKIFAFSGFAVLLFSMVLSLFSKIFL